jgi:ACS family hexuronate transporter-like MFS transporter
VTPSRWRWVIIGFAFLATVINYLDRQTLSISAPVLRDEFKMSNVAYSWVLFGFLLAYTIMNGISGAVIDRLGTKVGYALCVAWWSIAEILHVFARGTLSLTLFRFALGAGEAGNWPAAVKAVAQWFPSRERPLACGIFNSGGAVGAIIAPPLVTWLLLQYGWRTAFVAVGMTGLAWLAAWLAICPNAPPAARDGDGPDAPRSTPRSAPRVWSLIRTRFVVSFTVAKVFMDPVYYFYSFWFLEYLKRARHFDLASIGKVAWIPFFAAGLGNLLGGVPTAWLIRRGLSTTVSKKTAVTFFAILMTSAIPAVLVPQTGVSIAIISLAMFAYMGCQVNMLSMPSDVFPDDAVASVYGIASMGGGFGGMIFTLITGWLVDHFSYVPVFFGFGLIPLVSVTIQWLFLGSLDAPAGHRGT